MGYIWKVELIGFFEIGCYMRLKEGVIGNFNVICLRYWSDGFVID